ncbi:vWA domain-containing protein [Aureitalea marina]|uniref:VWFA domain-containing protein n=1 Tax=Aureitalea marina TaxID=930804 RepID=A0A2S7KU06_9FLAO|nr:VWA domain-containing protein [Aureitalea marina]PQB06038.1 hypothetical protein BST85_09665 [Aureitalea marina]
MKNWKTLALAFSLLGLVACKAETEKPIAQLAEIEKSPITKQHYIRVALLLDTSNSMDGLIDQAKAQLWEIVNELSYARCRNQRPDLQIALYEYGNDNLSSGSGYIRKILGFTSDLDDLSKELFSLTTNGGSEFCGTVIQASLKDLDWGNDDDDLKMIFIAGNEPFTQGNVDYRDAASMAKEKDVVVNTIFCGDYRHGVDTHWQDGARLTYGDYMSIDHNRQTVHIDSPYDDLILQLNIKLNKTYVPYGIRGKEKVAIQVAQDANAESYGKANAVGRTISKGSKFYKNSSWDLVDAMEEEAIVISDIESDNLPEELQDMNEEELTEYVKEKSAEREAIQSEINELNEKRRKFVADKKKATDNGLESALINALKKQAGKKNYTWQ